MNRLLRKLIKNKGNSEISCEENFKDNHLIKFVVRDHGVGISEDKIVNIFNSFTQVDGSATRGYEGTRLGLTISKRLVEMMGGEIWVESKLGAGTAVYFTAMFEKLGEQEEEFLEIPAEIKGSRVLLVEDHGTSRKAVQRILENLGLVKVKIIVKDQGLGYDIDDIPLPEFDKHSEGIWNFLYKIDAR